jgi:hypothetical protein
MMYLLADHSGLNKFAGENDPNFKIVCGVIESMVKDAPRVILQWHQGEDEEDWALSQSPLTASSGSQPPKEADFHGPLCARR